MKVELRVDQSRVDADGTPHALPHSSPTSAGTVFRRSDDLVFRPPVGLRRFSRSRKPPTNASAFSPARQRGGNFFNFLNVATSNHHIIGFDGSDEVRDHIPHIAPPLFLPVLLQASQPDIILRRPRRGKEGGPVP